MNPVWPTPFEEQLLLACFAPEEAAGAALDRCSRELAGTRMRSRRDALLPLVYRRWPEVENHVVDLGKRAYFTTWNRNRERMAELSGIAARFEKKESDGWPSRAQPSRCASIQTWGFAPWPTWISSFTPKIWNAPWGC